MTEENKMELEKIMQKIEALKKEAEKINPYIFWHEKTNKEFGEKYSETYILQQVPNLTKNNGAGHDMSGRKYKNIEVKSCRMTSKDKWTMNQIHPEQADAYLFVWYDCNDGTQEICFISTEELLRTCTLHKQHGDGCFTLSKTIKNLESLKKYMLSSWEELNEKV